MIPNLQPYPEYKESGSRWLAAVPAHWEVHNLRTLTLLKDDIQIYKQVVENESFRRFVTDMVFALTNE